MSKSLLEHLQNINAKSKEEMRKNPNVWIGLIVEDLEHWKKYGVTTVAQLDRYFLEVELYEYHKVVFGVKGRHYDFASMSDDDINKELDSLERSNKQREEAEKEWKEAEEKRFEEQIKKYLEYGASDRETAIRWIRQTS